MSTRLGRKWLHICVHCILIDGRSQNNFIITLGHKKKRLVTVPDALSYYLDILCVAHHITVPACLHPANDGPLRRKNLSAGVGGSSVRIPHRHYRHQSRVGQAATPENVYMEFLHSPDRAAPGGYTQLGRTDRNFAAVRLAGWLV